MLYSHTPAMAHEVIEYLNVRPGGVYVDCTLGGAGHARAIIERIAPGGFLVGIDQDKDAIEHAREVLSDHASEMALVRDNFENIESILAGLGIKGVDGILADLGISYHHLAESGRGFTFLKDEPLDMRMDTDLETTAADIVNNAGEKELADIFFQLGEERHSRRIARNIVRERKKAPIRTSFGLSRIVMDSIPKKAAYKPQRIHPSTRVFMSLRIKVNRELEAIGNFMDAAADLLKPGGRLCVLSFHSLEDRIVKHRIRALEKGCVCPGFFPKCVCGFKPKLRSLTGKPVRPTQAEVDLNPMARSTRLRVAERL